MGLEPTGLNPIGLAPAGAKLLAIGRTPAPVVPGLARVLFSAIFAILLAIGTSATTRGGSGSGLV